jgi:Lrp/AsnC family leucine-responsive transcriptional regulator
MDDTDRAILRALTANGRATASEIGREGNLSVPATAARIRKLEEAGVLLKYTVRLNREKTGRNLLAFLLIGVRSDCIDAFRSSVVLFPNVLECHHIAGEYDYLIKAAARDTAELEEFLSALKKMEGILRSNTIITLATLKEELNG